MLDAVIASGAKQLDAGYRSLSSFVFTVQYFNFVMHKPDAATA
jgi:hypothetical protein